MKILIIEDDSGIRELIEINLSIVGYSVLCAEDGEIGNRMIQRESIDLVLLDIMLPKIDGYELIEKIKKRNIPVIYITAKNTLMDKVKGLRLGADDYITKPFEAIEVIARIEAVLRRYQCESNLIEFYHLQIDINKRIIKSYEQVIELTLKEYELFLVLLRNKNIALSRAQLLDFVWGFDYIGESRTVDIHIQRLRDKLQLKEHIKTVFKVGYRLEG